MFNNGLLTLMCCLVCATLTAQSVDTTYLQEVRVYGLPVQTYAAGSKVEQLSSGDVQTMADALTNQSMIYLKTYGNNQLATVALRGTTASQTAVLWNGININSPTLGQTDFSLIPMFLFDEVSIRYGAASSMYGSDAIGGSILVGQKPAVFSKAFNARLLQQFGSFGKINSGIKAEFSRQRWNFRTSLYHAYIRNDFPYESRAVGYRKRQNDASVRNYGIDQQIHFKISDRQQISFEGMYTDNFREIQPSVTNNSANEDLKDKNARFSVNYSNATSLGVLSAVVGYVLNDQDYTNDVTSTVRSHQFVSTVSFDRNVSNRFNYRIGASYSQFRATAENYNEGLRDNRTDAYASLSYLITSRWLVNLNLRQSLYASNYAPFTPTLGSEYYLLNQAKNKLTIRAQAARGFRVPTLNDRYWVPGGNPDIKAEDAINVEGGLKWTKVHDNWDITIDGDVYRSWIDRMIVWLPDGNVYAPVNFQSVHIHGAELNASAGCKVGTVQLQSGLQYGYTRSINKEALNGAVGNTIGKQLAYVPAHSGRVHLGASWNNWRASVRSNPTSRRYTTIDNLKAQSLDPYALIDVSMSKTFTFNDVLLDITAEALNLLDTYYENLANHALPGRNFSIAVNMKLN